MHAIFRVCIVVRGKKGRGQAALIGALGTPVMPICSNSIGPNPVIHGVFVLSAVRVQTSGCEESFFLEKRRDGPDSRRAC
ncbi:hypothetical protein Y032_0401g790 [Ancylostoma ceylanicum]|uniref:Uncharacterized protein n=1 Tax=Ancylostoma ceylanicum TaxID=53326 RepID=A0A016X344_9BILA|nr:hypothetical protein Y032_0401g790 [Ancylostoma ceylanicum]